MEITHEQIRAEARACDLRKVERLMQKMPEERRAGMINLEGAMTLSCTLGGDG